MSGCRLPWISVKTTPMETTRACCLYTDEIPNVDLQTHTLEEAVASETMQELRTQFSDDEKPDGCRNCWREEDAGKKSKREYMLEKFKHIDIDYTDTSGKELVFLDLKLGLRHLLTDDLACLI